MSPGTPQKNGVVKRGFATLYYRVCVMMTHEGHHENFKAGLWSECTETATKIENVMINPHEQKYAHEKFHQKMADYAKYLRTFGEIRVVRIIATVKEKPEDREKTCMFLSFVKNYSGGTY